MSAWLEADRRYQAHHLGCLECRAAGAAPGTQRRCDEGRKLWKAYQQAGRPPHMTWRDVPASTTPMRVKPPRP